MPKTATLRLLTGSITEIAAGDDQVHLIERQSWVKCKVCRWLVPHVDLGKTAFVVNCVSCDYRAIVCDDCGGEERAVKSVKYHASYYMREKVITEYGKQHKPAWTAMLRAMARDKKFGVINGGKA